MFHVRFHGADGRFLTGDIHLVILLAHHHGAQFQPVVQGHQATFKAQHNGEGAGDQQAGEELAQVGQLLSFRVALPGDGAPEGRGDDGGGFFQGETLTAEEVIDDVGDDLGVRLERRLAS